MSTRRRGIWSGGRAGARHRRHEEALSYVDNARSLWEGDRSALAADLLDRRAAALDSLGRTREAIDASQEAATLWQELERDDRYAASMGKACRQLNWVMDFGASLRELERALTVLRAAPAPLRAPLLYLRAATLANRATPRRLSRHWRRPMACARR